MFNLDKFIAEDVVDGQNTDYSRFMFSGIAAA